MGNKQIYSAIVIANYFLEKYDSYGISPMKLNKLVFLAHGWHLGLTQESLISEEPEAWQYGPVIPSLYFSFKKYGKNNLYYESNGITPSVFIDSETKKFLDKIWEVYGSKTAIELSSLTHEKDSPWDKAWNEYMNRNSNIIPNINIKNYYVDKVSENKKKKS